ncbi:hypothetical protein PG999_012711 [Apiospora kogelbergensis]|uniref:DUF4352 domain-containing protein n=1 Tax=Apiospora kogelbergensis TaxID=1337665 RepID=A0AAW0Q9S1_9PEZI
MLFKPLALLAVALGAIYAYGKGISGLPIVRVKDSAYLTNITSVPSGFPIQNVTFSCVSERRTLTASSTPQGNTTAATSFFAFKKDTGLATFTEAEDDASAMTTGYIFFGNALFVDMNKHMEAKWVAIPVEVDGQSLFQIGWNVTTAGTIPILLNTKAPMHQ